MHKFELLIPQPQRPPAKIKDAGVVSLVVRGHAVYNAKSHHLLLLPAGENDLSAMLQGLKKALLEQMGAQPVVCDGVDSAVYSIAERYVRDFGARARTFQELFSREIRLISWCENQLEIAAKSRTFQEALSAFCQSQGFSVYFTEGVTCDGGRYLKGVTPAQEEARNALGAFLCSSCEAVYSLDSSIAPPSLHRETVAGKLEASTDLHTPNCATISDLCDFLKIRADEITKAVIYATEESQQRILVAFVRGDREINPNKLACVARELFGIEALRKAQDSEISKYLGESLGYCGPIGLPQEALVITDISVDDGIQRVVGANRIGYHRGGCCFGRDYTSPLADISSWKQGDLCPQCHKPVTHCFWRSCATAHDTLNSDSLSLAYRDREGERVFPFVFRASVSMESLLLSKACIL